MSLAGREKGFDHRVFECLDLKTQNGIENFKARHLSSEGKKEKEEREKEKWGKNRCIQLKPLMESKADLSEEKLFSKLRASGERPLIAKLNLTRRETSPRPLFPGEEITM